MAQELLAQFQEWTESVTLRPGGRKDFEISVNGRLIFSKQEIGEFPTLDQINQEIAGILNRD